MLQTGAERSGSALGSGMGSGPDTPLEGRDPNLSVSVQPVSPYALHSTTFTPVSQLLRLAIHSHGA